ARGDRVSRTCHVQPYPRPKRVERNPAQPHALAHQLRIQSQRRADRTGAGIHRRTQQAARNQNGAVRDQPCQQRRQETPTLALRRGSFKTMLANKRCVIPAEGFYEWREENGKKQPYFFARKDGKPVMFAGIWDYSDVKGEAIPSFAILTDEPNELVAPYHDRMPVVLGDVERWLNLDTTLDDVDPL